MLIVTALLQPGDVEDVQPGIEAEALPDEVALAGRVVEAEQGHHRDRRHQVHDRRSRCR